MGSPSRVVRAERSGRRRMRLGRARLRLEVELAGQRRPLAEATAIQFSAVGHSAAIIRVRRQDLLGRRVLVVTVVTSEACHLDFNSPVGQRSAARPARGPGTQRIPGPSAAERGGP